MPDMFEEEPPSVQQRVRDRWFNEDLRARPEDAWVEKRPSADDPMQRFLRDGWTR